MEVPFCEIDGRALGVMQFRVLVEVPLCERGGNRGHVGVLVEVLFCEIDDQVVGGLQFRVLAALRN